MRIILVAESEEEKNSILFLELSHPETASNALIYIGEQFDLEKVEGKEGEYRYRAFTTAPASRQDDS